MASADVAIRIRGLSKRYTIAHDSARPSTLGEAMIQRLRHPFAKAPTETFWALHDVELEIQRGDVVGIIGRNGAGKSTLFKILSRITEPTSGQIDLFGRVGSLLEVGTGFHPELTGRENIYLNGAILGMRKSEIARQFDDIVEFAEIGAFLDTPVKRYSSGMYVRLAFAVAAHLQSEILIVDEVLAVGDAQFQDKCMGKMGQVASAGRTVLFVSHNLPAVRRLCHRAVYLEKGRVKSIGPVDAVAAEYFAATTASVRQLRSAPVGDGQCRLTGWELRHEGAMASHSCVSGEKCRFVFTLESKLEIPRAQVALVIRDRAGNLIVVVNSLDDGGAYMAIGRGVYEISIELSLPVKPGQYDMDICVKNEHWATLEQWVPDPSLIVMPRRDYSLPDEWRGLVDEGARFGCRAK